MQWLHLASNIITHAMRSFLRRPSAVVLIGSLAVASVCGGSTTGGTLNTSTSARGGLELVLVHTEAKLRGAACLDGSPPGYFIRSASAGSNSSKWVVHMQGGGWCWDVPERADHGRSCANRSKLGQSY